MTTRSQADSHTVVASHHGWWTGDVWRTALLLKRVRPDLRFLVLDAAPTGLVLITNLDPTSRKLADGYEEYVAKMLEWQISGGGLEALHAEMRVQPTQAFADPESMVEFVQGQRAPMRTLVFCTAFARTQEIWRTRYRRWIDILRASSLEFQQLLIVDDGSPVLPDWSDAQIVTEAEVRQPELLRTDAPLVLYHYMENLGRREIYDFPGWYRSFAFAARYAGQRKFEKVIHLESDAYLLSPGMHAWANRLDSGWIALYSPKYEFPEMAIQLVAGPEVQHFAAYFAHPYDRLVHRTHELALPYTHVERGFKGDRYGESLMDVPKDADYVTQVQTDREDSYYWWAGGTNKSPKVAQVDEELTIHCSEGGNSDRYIGAGWAYAEPDRRWMIGEESTLRLPPLLNWRLYTVLMSVIPHVSGTNLLSQRLLVKLNGGFVASFSLEAGTTLAVELPVDLVNIADSNVLTFEHPDACAPSRHSPSGDHRELAIAVTEISLRSKALVPNVL
jgi:hypothetical protein